nr:hypothetical protein [Thiomargarita sp.]
MQILPKKNFNQITLILIQAMAKSFLGMFIAIAVFGIASIILVFFEIFMPKMSTEMIWFEITGLLLIGTVIGAIVGFFDMLDFEIDKTSKRD